MTRLDALYACLHALAGYRLRATLAALGVTIGIATIVTGFAIGEGAREAALAEISGLGIENIFIRGLHRTDTDAHGRPRTYAPQLTIADAQAVAALPGVEIVAVARTVDTSVERGAQSAPATLAGVSVAWQPLVGVHTPEGRWINDADARDARQVAVLGGGLAFTLFGHHSPVGEHVRVAGRWLRVVGVLATTPRVGEHARSVPQLDAMATVFVPVSAMDESLGIGDAPNRVQHIALKVRDAGAVEPIRRAVQAVLDRRQREGAFQIVVPRALLQARVRAQRTFNVVLYAIGALALLVSGVGIMNILLASVVERTHEIGIRRAFGARREDVLWQFALEAAVLSVAGAIVGVPLGWCFAAIVAWLAGWPVAISGVSVLLALALAALLGIGFGVYPARVAADLQPAIALREE